MVRAENLRFKEEGVRDVLKDVLLPWYNAYRFFLQNILRLQKVWTKVLWFELHVGQDAFPAMLSWVCSDPMGGSSETLGNPQVKVSGVLAEPGAWVGAKLYGQIHLYRHRSLTCRRVAFGIHLATSPPLMEPVGVAW